MMKQYAIGIDVGGTTVKIGLFRTEGELLKKWEIRTRTEQEGRFILPDAAASVRKSLENEGISLSEVEGVGIGVPGAVLESGVVNRCVNLGWGVVDVAGQFGCRYRWETMPMWPLLEKCGKAAARAFRIWSWSRWALVWAAA